MRFISDADQPGAVTPLLAKRDARGGQAAAVEQRPAGLAAQLQTAGEEAVGDRADAGRQRRAEDLAEPVAAGRRLVERIDAQGGRRSRHGARAARARDPRTSARRPCPSSACAMRRPEALPLGRDRRCSSSGSHRRCRRTPARGRARGARRRAAAPGRSPRRGRSGRSRRDGNGRRRSAAASGASAASQRLRSGSNPKRVWQAILGERPAPAAARPRRPVGASSARRTSRRSSSALSTTTVVPDAMQSSQQRLGLDGRRHDERAARRRRARAPAPARARSATSTPRPRRPRLVDEPQRLVRLAGEVDAELDAEGPRRDAQLVGVARHRRRSSRFSGDPCALSHRSRRARRCGAYLELPGLEPSGERDDARAPCSMRGPAS